MGENYWFVYLGLNLVFTSIYAALASKYNILLLELENNGIITKMIFAIAICVVFFLTEVPDSLFIRFSSRNDLSKDE